MRTLNTPTARSVRALLFAFCFTFTMGLHAQVKVYTSAALDMEVGNHPTIQAALDDATTLANYFVQVPAGTYNETVSITKNGITLTAEGAGATITGGGADGINLNANDVTIDNFTVTGFNDGLELASSDGVTLLNCSFDNNITNNLKVSNAAVVTNFTVSDCSFDGAVNGWYVSNSSSGGANTFDGITVVRSTFDGNARKGIYVEKMSNASFDQITVDGSGIDPTFNFNAGVDINLKWAAYTNISFTNSAFINSGVAGPSSNPDAPIAISIKARDDAPSYSSPAATLDNVVFTNNVVTGPENGLGLGEPGKSNNGPTTVVVNDNDLSHSFNGKALLYNVVGAAPEDLNAQCNWWGTTDANAIALRIGGTVSVEPFLAAGGDSGSAAPGFSPTSECDGCSSGGLVTNTSTGEVFCSIQAAIDVAASGNTITVDVGTFVENINFLGKSLTLQGANAGINPNDADWNPNAARGLESIIEGTIVGNKVGFTIDGFTLKANTGGKMVNVTGGGTSGTVTLENNIFLGEDLAAQALLSGSEVTYDISSNTFTGFTAGNFVLYPDGNVLINSTYSGNLFYNNSMNGIIIPGSVSGSQTISGNKFDQSGTAIILGSGGHVISSNIITNSGGGVYTESGNNSITNNEFTNTSYALFVNGGTTANILQENSLLGGYTSGANAGISVRNTTSITVDANCNWYGTTVLAEIQAKGSGPVDFVPYLINGTDDDLGTPGFQSVPMACIGGPVRVYSDAALTMFVSGHVSLQEAINAGTTTSGDFIQIDAGTFIESGQIIIDKDLTIIGAGKTHTTIMTDQNTGTGGDARGWWLVNTGVTLDLQDLKLDGSGFLIYQAIRQKGSGSIDNVHFTEIKYNESGPHYQGVAVAAFGDGNVDISNSMFDEIGRIGVLYFGTGITGSSFSGNMYTGKGVGDFLDYALDISAGAIVNVTDNTIQGNKGTASSDGSKSAGILVSTFFAAGTEATITGNVITDNTCGITVGFDGADASTVEIHNNDIFGNTLFGVNTTGPVVNASGNYWGATDGPSVSGGGAGDAIGEGIDACPFYDAPVNSGGTPSLIDCPVFVYDEDPGTGTLQSSHFTIQSAIDASTTLAGYFVVASAGTFEEDVNVNKSITVQGAGMDVSTVIGPIGGNGATFRVSAPGVTIDGFTITRAGNNTTDWNDAGLNSAGIAIQGQANDAEIRNCKITGNRTGIDVNNSNDNNIHNNVITSNRTGLLFRNQTDNTILVENEITDSWTMGILFLDASGGSNSPVQSAVNSTFNDNNISGNWYGQIVDRQAGGSLPAPGTNLKNFECNWFGTTTPVVSTMDSAEPGYSSIPVAYGGTATAPGGQPDILGPGSANFEYILHLINGTDDEPGTAGFQPVPLSCAGGCPGGLAVINTTTGESFCSIQDAIDDADTQDGHTIEVIAGTYNESVIVDKSLTILGPNASISPITGTRVAEAILVNVPTGRSFSIKDGNTDVTISGFKFDGGSPIHDGHETNTPRTSDVTFSSNLVVNSNAIYAGTNTSWADLIIHDNKFEDVNATATTSALYLVNTNSSTVTDNVFTNVNYAAILADGTPTIHISGNNIDGTGAQAIQLANVIGDATIEDNSINNANGSQGVDRGAIRLYGSGFTGTILITGNAITGGHNGIAVKNGEDITGKDITITENSITNLTSGKAIYHGGTGTLQANCNWFGTAIFDDVADEVVGSVDFIPYLSDGTDNAPGTVGFQPAPLSCTGGPVQVYDGNTFIAVYTEIQAAIDAPTTLSGHTVRIASGTYAENVDAVSGGKDLIFAPGASPGCVTINGDFTLNAGDALEIEIEGTTACTEHDQFIVTGTVDLGGADIITPLGMYLAADGDEIVIIDGSSAASNTFSQGNFVTDGTNNYYIDYAGGTDDFDVVLTKCCVGLLDLGIANYAAASPAGNKLQVFVQPSQDVVNGAYSAGVFTIRTLTSNGVTFTKLGGALSPFDYNQAGTFTDGGYTYYLFSYESVNNVDWMADGTEYLLLTLSYDCIGDAEFELTNDAVTLANNGGYYQELGAAEAQGVFYQPTATSPTSVSITADNSGAVCDGVDIDLSSMTSDGTAPYTYLWSGPGGYSSTDADPAPFPSTLASNGTYTVTVTDANGCTATATTEVTVLDNAACVHNVTQNNYYPTITQAIDAAATVDDDVLFVPAADWPENVVVTKALTINGANAGTSCDDGARGAESVILGTTVVIIASDGVTLDGFTLEGITGVSSAGFKDVGLINNKINAKQFGINSSQITTSAGEGYIMQDNCINFCSQVFDAEGFATNPTLASAQTAGEWYTDRYAPAGFVAEVFDGDSRLKHSIDAADCASCRGGGQTGAFYNTQGRKYDISGAKAMSIELYVPADWATTGRRMAGFWGTALDAGSSISGYPIIEFTSEDGTPRFRGWDNAGFWVDLGLPSGFAYDEWYTLEIALLPNDEFMYSVGDISTTVAGLGSTIIDNVILQGHNTDTPGVTYDIYWDNFNTFCAPVELNSQTIGINLASADGSEAVVLQDNNVSNSFYAYVLGDVTTTSRTTVQGGEFTDIMQGVVVANIVNGVNFAPSSVGVSNLSMTSFSGNYPALPAFNFHSGVYGFTGGADAAATVDLLIDNVTVSNTGKPQQDAAGISFVDFSTGADPRLTATVTNSVISNNVNRGVNVRGQNASVTISDSDILSNGGDPFGAGGNNGFGVYAGVGSRVELYNNNIVNPASQAGAFPVTAIFNGVAPASTIIANNNLIDDSGNGDITRNPYDISFFDATCNWWGSSDVDDIDALVEGNVYFLPYLDDGTDDQPGDVGFQTSADCINPTAWYVNDNALTDDVFTQDVGDDTNPGTKRRPFRTIGHAVMTVENNTSTGPDDNSIYVDAGSYDEQVVVPNTVGNLTLQGVGSCDDIAPALTTMVNFTGTVTGKPTIFDVAGDGSVIDGFQFNVDLSKLNSAIIASHSGLDNITVQNNCIDPYQSVPGTNFGSYGNRNAISINYAGFRVASGGVDNILVDNNRVTATVNGVALGDDAGDIAFRSAVSVDEGAGTYTRNVFQSINHDVLVRFNSNGDVIIGGSAAEANTFNGGGVQYADPNAAGGTVTISHNAFDGSVSNSVLRLQNNYHNAAVAVSDNMFSNLRWGASLENFSNVTVADNVFSPLAGFSDFRLITVNTKSISGNSAAIVQVPIDGVFTGNTFNAGAAGTGTAMAFYNHDSDNATLGSFTVGTSGSPNIFAPGFLFAVYLGDQLGSTLAAIADFPEYNLGAGSDTDMACWDRDIDVQNNSFDIGSGPQLPSTMNNPERLALEDILYHLPDNACLGELIYFDPVLVDAKVFLQGPYDSVSGLMNDDLRAGGLVPVSEPFSSINAAHPGAFVKVNNFVTETIDASVLAVTGDDAIVDWVWLELHDRTISPDSVVATRSALVQRDGDIVDLDGNASVEFPDTYVGQYYLLVRHRNHLGAMTANPVDFTAVMPIDFTIAAEPTFGATTTSARRLVKTGIYGLWAGNTFPYPAAGFNVKYNGSDNDRLVILNAIGNTTPLNILSNTYQLEDVNMDGRVKYNGSQNDRVIILQNVGPSSPLNIITQEPNN